jgi:hypothetical protein
MERDPSAKKYGYSRHSYMWALEEGLVPIYKPDDIFQHNNAPIHIALRRAGMVGEAWHLDTRMAPFSTGSQPY